MRAKMFRSRCRGERERKSKAKKEVSFQRMTDRCNTVKLPQDVTKYSDANFHFLTDGPLNRYSINKRVDKQSRSFVSGRIL